MAKGIDPRRQYHAEHPNMIRGNRLQVPSDWIGTLVARVRSETQLVETIEGDRSCRKTTQAVSGVVQKRFSGDFTIPRYLGG